MELKDKEVDKMIAKRGYQHSEIFYSPISSWFVTFLLFGVIIVPLIFCLISYLLSGGSPIILGIVVLYFLIGYTFIALLNRSFAVTKDELLIINSHFPLQKIKPHPFREIKSVRISSNKLVYLLLPFLLGRPNYIEVKFKNDVKRYYCLFLDVDAFDENWTEKTLDDLKISLKDKGINVIFELD